MTFMKQFQFTAIVGVLVLGLAVYGTGASIEKSNDQHAAGVSRMAIPSGLVVDTQFKLVNGVQVTTGHINDQQFSIECSRAEKLNDKLKLYQNLYRLSSTPVGSAKSISLIGPQYAFELNGMLCYALPAKCAVTLVEYAKQKSRLELAEIMPNFMDQTMKGLSIMHQSGWIHKGINPSTLCVNSPKNNPSIFVRITDQAAPLISRGNNVVPQLPRAPFLLYSTEWVQKTAVDPRLEDTWDAAALFYGVSRTIPTNQVAIAQAKAKIAELIGQINKLGYRSNEPRDRVSPMLSKFMGFFSSEYADNSSDRNKAPAILLGAEKVLPRMYFRDVQYIPRHPDFYFTPNLADLLMAAVSIPLDDPAYQGDLKEIANGYFNLNVWSVFTKDVEYNGYKFSPMLERLNLILKRDPQQRPTPQQYLERVSR